MRLVLDTDVIVAGLRSRTGALRQLLILLGQRRHQAVASVAMMLEHEAVLSRTDNLAAFNALLEKAGTDEVIEGDELPVTR